MDIRRIRALTEQIRSVRLDISPEEIVFHILGSRKVVYKVHFVPNERPKCSCPDNTIHRNTCKHIFFVCVKIFNMEPDDFKNRITDEGQQEKLAETVKARMPHLLNVMADANRIERYNNHLDGNDEKEVEAVKFRNEECCICLCDLESDGKGSEKIIVCGECRNGVHSDCWKGWISAKRGRNCVYCRRQVCAESSGKGIIKDDWGIQLL